MPIKIGINGFGRIGRIVARAAQASADFEITHINDLTDTKTLCHLLTHDSVHGRAAFEVKAEAEHIVLDGHKVSITSCRNPADIPWGDKKVDVVFECTGIFTKREDADKHIHAGAPRVIISAPAKGEDITVVMGVNDDKLKADHTVISNGSCTTNCLAPVAKVLNEKFGIKHGLMTTIHAYTNDQKVLDLPHKDLRRARAAGLSMIPTSTGAAKAIALVLPELKGKLNGMAIRVPTPNVSMIDLTVETEQEASIESVNAALKDASQGALKGILGFSEEPLVSIDYNGCTQSSTVDAMSTDVIGGHLVKVVSWYDNETGFSYRMLDAAKRLLS